MANVDSPLSTVIFVCLTTMLSYLGARLGGALILPPEMVSPLWLGNVFLASVLVLAPRRIWPILLVAGLAGFLFFDLQAGEPTRSLVWLILSNAVEILIAVLCLRSSFKGVPQLNSVKALARYSFYAVFLAPFVGAFLGALSSRSHYWASWRVAFFSEALGFLTLMPAILGWVREIPIWARKPRAYHLEAAALLAGLVLVGYIAFTASTGSNSPALLYALVPFLLWSALRFGPIGVSTSMIAIAFVSIWGAVHDRGPFTGPGPLTNVLSLQLFLFFMAAPFMVLAALVEDRKLASKELALANDRLLLAMEAGTSVAWDLDVRSGRDHWFGNLQTVFGIPTDAHVGEAQDFIRYVHPDDRQRVSEALADARQDRKLYAPEFRIVRRDGMIRWLVARGKFYYASNDDPERMLGVSLDITERKLAEEAVRESESRYRRIVETTNEGIWLLDSNLHTSYVNRQMAEMIGYEPEQMIGQSVFNFYFPEDIGYKKQVLERRQQGVREQIEERLRRRDGSELWVRIAATPIFKDNGEFDGALAMVSDITGHKRTEKTLSESEERFRLAAQAGKMYAYEWDVATDKVMRSEGHLNVLGFSDEAKQLSRQQLLARVHPDDRALFGGSVDQLTPQNPTTQISYRVLRPDGSLVWLEKIARAFFDEQGRMLRVIGMVSDITERKRAEEALRESEDKLRLLLDSTAEAIYGIDLEGRCTFCNPACLRALGYGHIDELLGKNMHDLIHHTRADGTLFPVEECQIFRAFRTEEGAHVDSEVLWRANGTSFPAEYWSHPQRKGQEVVGAVVAFIDITGHKLAEEALASVGRRLIEAQEQERTRIARELHDDFSQRLALITGELEVLQKDPSNLSQVRSRVGELWRQASEITTDIQSLSHELHSSKLEYLGVAAAIRGFCKEFGEQKNVKIDFQTHDLPSPLPPDTSLCLFRVLQEALHNSAKHSGVRHFELRLWGTPGEIHLTVRDSGSGFNREAARESRGLGLISMEERLKLVNGSLFIDSEPEHGTTIHARVPLGSRRDSMRAAG
jgi:PAS domain S-box-containing protein